MVKLPLFALQCINIGLNDKDNDPTDTSYRFKFHYNGKISSKEGGGEVFGELSVFESREKCRVSYV